MKRNQRFDIEISSFDLHKRLIYVYAQWMRREQTMVHVDTNSTRTSFDRATSNRSNGTCIVIDANWIETKSNDRWTGNTGLNNRFGYTITITDAKKETMQLKRHESNNVWTTCVVTCPRETWLESDVWPWILLDKRSSPESPTWRSVPCAVFEANLFDFLTK